MAVLMHRNKVKPGKMEMARSLRNGATQSERLLWEQIRRKALGYRFRRQVVMFGWIADFYCPDRRLVIELDGRFHADRVEQDRRRDAAMVRSGVRTIRIPSRLVFEDMDAVLTRIRRACELPMLKGDGYFESKWRPESSTDDLYQRLLAAQPKACPECGSGEIAPLFEGDLWDCSRCAHAWEA